IQLLDERVVSIVVSYPGPPWNYVDDMVSKVAIAFNLPGVNSWIHHAPMSKSLKCEGFEIIVTACGGGTCCSMIGLRVPMIDEQVQQRRAADEEKARREFTP